VRAETRGGARSCNSGEFEVTVIGIVGGIGIDIDRADVGVGAKGARRARAPRRKRTACCMRVSL